MSRQGLKFEVGKVWEADVEGSSAGECRSGDEREQFGLPVMDKIHA